MELRVEQVAIPEKIKFNYEQLKTELTEKVSMYSTLVYTDETIKDAKNDRANLNKLKKALNDERIRREKEYMQPFNEFKAQINEIIGIIDKPVALIDTQIKSYEEQQKKEKKAKIVKYFEEKYINSGTPAPDCFTLQRIFDDKWLNASTSMKSIQTEIDAKAEQIKNDLDTLSNLPEFSFEATEVYKRNLDINTALNEGKKLAETAKKKAEREAELARQREEAKRLRAEQEAEKARLAAEVEAKKQEEQVEGQITFTDAQTFDENVVKPAQEVAEELPMWIAFKACLTVSQAKELKQFFEDRNIEFKAV